MLRRRCMGMMLRCLHGRLGQGEVVVGDHGGSARHCATSSTLDVTRASSCCLTPHLSLFQGRSFLEQLFWRAFSSKEGPKRGEWLRQGAWHMTWRKARATPEGVCPHAMPPAHACRPAHLACLCLRAWLF